MATLAVAGVPLPVRIDSLTLSDEQVGFAGRNVNGVRLLDRRIVKRVVEFDVAPRGLDEAMLYRLLLTAEGDYWSMATDGYSSRGVLAGGTGAWSSSAPVLWGAGTWEIDNTQTLTLPLSAWETGAGRWNGGALAWHRRDKGTAVTSACAISWRAQDTAQYVKRQRVASSGFGRTGTYGAAGVFAETDSFAITASQISITRNSAGAIHIGDVLYLPRYLPQAELDLLLAGLTQRESYLPAHPAVGVQMDIAPAIDALTSGVPHDLVAHGEVGGMRARPHFRSGSFDKTALEFSARLTEV